MRPSERDADLDQNTRVRIAREHYRTRKLRRPKQRWDGQQWLHLKGGDAAVRSQAGKES